MDSATSKISNFFRRSLSVRTRKTADTPGQSRDQVSVHCQSEARPRPPLPQRARDQSQSLFFAKLPPEVRMPIYIEALGGKQPLHILKPRRGLFSVRCRGNHGGYKSCACLIFQYKWEDTSSTIEWIGPQRQTALLKTCKLMYVRMAFGLVVHYVFHTFNADDK